MKVLVLSEGVLDIGNDADRKGAVGILVRRLLEEKLGRDVHPKEIVGGKLHRAHRLSPTLSGYEQKVQLAIAGAAIDGHSSVAIVVDRDRTNGRKRLEALHAGRDLAAQKGHDLAHKTAIGVAVETVEAWLLADEKALNEALDPHPPERTSPSPEQLDGAPKTNGHPKVRFQEIRDRARTETTSPYDAVAERARLDILESRCPTGFAPFAAEVRDRCG